MSFTFKKLTTSERVTRMKIELQESHPFFARLIMNLDIKEDVDKRLPEEGGMGINVKNELIYKKEFVDKLSDPELKFVLAHEVMHLCFTHLTRLGNRDPLRFNCAADIVVNDILQSNQFTPPDCGLIPTSNHEFVADTVTITNINEKSAEQVYDQLPIIKQKPGSDGQGGGNKDGSGYGKGFDKHFYESLSDKDKKEIEESWGDQIIDAANYAKSKGNLPAGMDRYIKEILNPQVNWRQLLYKYITSQIPFDYTYSRQSKKSRALGIYMPSVLKETIEIVAHVDTSGSISQKELSEFLSEIVGIANSFQNIKITLIECDAAIQQVIEITPTNTYEVEEMKIKGGGGTSHKPVWEYIEENIPNCKLCVSLTDGYSDISAEDQANYNVIFVLCKNAAGDDAFPFGQIVRLEDD